MHCFPFQSPLPGRTRIYPEPPEWSLLLRIEFQIAPSAYFFRMRLQMAFWSSNASRQDFLLFLKVGCLRFSRTIRAISMTYRCQKISVLRMDSCNSTSALAVLKASIQLFIFQHIGVLVAHEEVERVHS